MQAEFEVELPKYMPIINKFMAGTDMSDEERLKLDEFSVKMRPMNYTMLQFIIDEPKMGYDDIVMMMEVLDGYDTETLLSYVSLMTSEKASVMKRIYDKRMQEAEMITV